MRNLTWTVIVVLVFFFSSAVHANTATDTHKTLKSVCEKFAQKWVGVDLHYKHGRREFETKCRAAIKGEDLLSGLWAIRSLVPDGHASFSIKEETPSLIHPVVLNYDPVTKSVKIAAVFDKGAMKYLGNKVSLINGKDAIEVVQARAKMEPQSTQDGSMEIAARTLLFQPAWHTYPDFPDDVIITLENRDEIVTKPASLDDLFEKHRQILSKDYPSIWGNIINTEDVCTTGDEIAKIITYRGSKWLWWHPKSMSFHSSNVGSAL